MRGTLGLKSNTFKLHLAVPTGRCPARLTPMALDFRPLPVRVTELADESGLGFLLRCAQANGLRLPSLANYAGVKSLQWVGAADIEMLAFLAQVSPVWLAQRLQQRHWIDRRPYISYGALNWGWIGSLRVQRPQVCCACLRETPFCKSAWEVTSVVACVIHQLPLIDQCRHCHRPLSWSRPAVDVCQCGRYLSAEPTWSEPSEQVLVWCQSIVDKLHGSHVGETRAFSDVTPPEWPWHTSPDGAYRLIHSFGVLERANQGLPRGKVTETPTTTELTEILERGLIRGMLLSEASRDVARDLRDKIYIAGIERLARFGVFVADRQIANSYLRRLDQISSSDSALRRHWRGGKKPRGQLELFAHDDG